MQEKDFQWFVRNYDSLYNKYGRSILAIKNENVLGVFSNYIDAITKISEKEPLGSFIVQECNGEESAYTNYVASII